MGRKKHVPKRSVAIVDRQPSEAELGRVDVAESSKDGSSRVSEPFFVVVDRSSWVSEEHYDLSEIVLLNLNVSGEFYGCRLGEELYRDSRWFLRFRVSGVDEHLDRIRLGHWPVLSEGNVSLEFVMNCTGEGDEMETEVVVVSGSVDGPDEGVTGLVHLVGLKYLTVRPIVGVTLLEGMPSMRVRVQILGSLFGQCESLLDDSKKLWKKSMMSLMAWLRPEVMTSETRYRYSDVRNMDGESVVMDDDSLASRKQTMFDISSFYEAIKSSKEEPMLDDNLPDLLPELRPYQRRAAYWMVQREKIDYERLVADGSSQIVPPLCVPLNLIDTSAKIYYNPFSGNVSLHPSGYFSHVYGGILADEMGLGKTVELLSCIFAHRMPASEIGASYKETQSERLENNKLKRLKMERVECVCGAVSESYMYEGLWVQCDLCDAWQHGDCVRYSAKVKVSESGELDGENKCKEHQSGSSTKNRKRKNDFEVIEMDREHICQTCLALIQATEAPIATGATLIVCPTPILVQWHAEILRHTRPGSLRICVYEGVKYTSFSNEPIIDIDELLNADIVLTTYEVLKEDLPHDSERHDGDRRFLRYGKRYEVVPTLLTRVFWWRICLDEAQMVEGNAAAAIELALRLHAKYRWCVTGTPIQRKLDDLYGLLRFLQAGPFDVPRWWSDVILKPCEMGDAGAMNFIQKYFKQIMWRSSKGHVWDELQLPDQEECVSWLSLSAIEEHFYQRQHETCVHDAREVVESFKDDVGNSNTAGMKSSNASSERYITNMEATKLFNSLLKLRQACCHPQVGSSGLRSLQSTPMTMEEVLLVLVGKTKIEGEDALRKLVVALNGLAGIAIIKEDFSGAALLYKEALSLAKDHSEDFRLDPLLNIHVLYNLAEILPLIPDNMGQNSAPTSSRNTLSGTHEVDKTDNALTGDKMGRKDPGLDLNSTNSIPPPSCQLRNGEKSYDSHLLVSAAHVQSLRASCEDLKQKFLSVSSSKLSVAQQDFRKTYGQVCDALRKRTDNDASWWLEALDNIDQDKDSSRELIDKIGEAVSGSLNKKSKPSASFRSPIALKYYIQTGLDALEGSRDALLDRLLEVDQAMDNPREEDIIRVRYCNKCNSNCDGPACTHCELDEIFQAYEARLFRLRKSNNGEAITSAEEAVNLQKKTSARNQFYKNLSRTDKSSATSAASDEDTGKRNMVDKLTVSKSPSDLEIVLTIIRNSSRGFLGRERLSVARQQLDLLEGMRKEYPLARTLAIAQAQVLRAHDEIKMATSRLRVRENEDDKLIDALSMDELDGASVENSSEKFVAEASLSRIKGQLRYLKGLVQSTQTKKLENADGSLTATEMTGVSENTQLAKADVESCPVCQDQLSNQKMVFQCGHMTCLKCFFAITERRLPPGHHRSKWVMCPTCRQSTDFGNIAFADDKQNGPSGTSDESEMSITVQGSYSTKIEAVTRRILWINSRDPNAKILVFSSWKDVLDVLQHALAANSISYVRMKGGKKSKVAISLFTGQKSSVKESNKKPKELMESKSVQVLLLLIQDGGNGLNLLEAQHVILVEPLLNPAAEAQAIGRVHRIGQKHKTLVHRFIVKDTVEESIYKMNKSRNSSSFISGNRKNQDQPFLTLRDVESLFRVAPAATAEDQTPSGSMRDLPPSVAAALAAERRLMDAQK